MLDTQDLPTPAEIADGQARDALAERLHGPTEYPRVAGDDPFEVLADGKARGAVRA